MYMNNFVANANRNEVNETLLLNPQTPNPPSRHEQVLDQSLVGNSQGLIHMR